MITKIPQIVASVAIAVSFIGSGVFYWQKTQSELESRQSKISLLEATLAQNTQALQKLQEDYVKAYSIISQTNESIDRVKQQNVDLRTRIANNQLDDLLKKDSAEVENVLNQATSDMIRCMELVSGSPLTMDEINAKTPKEFNSRCPWFFGTRSAQ